VDVTVNKLSSCKPREFSVENNVLKKYKRYYSDGYALNFYNIFTKIRDVKYKNYTTFYLTDEFKLSDVLSDDIKPIKSDGLLTSLNFGGNYLKFSPLDERFLGESLIFTDYDQYGTYSFVTDSINASNFVVDMAADNTCQIYHVYNYKKYYLGFDNTGKISFYGNKANFQRFTFNYIYSASTDSLCLFENSTPTCKLLVKSGNNLALQPIVEDTKILAYNNPIKIDKPLYANIEDTKNFSLVGYNESNTVPNNLLQKDIKNSYLLHSETDNIELITLKNQLTQDDIFTSGNTLLSTSPSPFFIDGMRDYTSIFDDISNEKDESLSLNYVFYNKSYTIQSGENYLKAPSDMSPYAKININDTKFIECGAFSFDTPVYADKVYKLDNENGYNDGQVYLCTWLSGSPLGDSKVWVDRYYYPDFIEKSEALKLRASFNPTYENLIEQLVKNNTSIKDSLSSFGVFDKKSDLVIEPNDEFIYDRIGAFESIADYDFLGDALNFCDIDNLDYFEKVNESGQLTLFLNFDGDLSTWIFKSGRGNIQGGFEITKFSDSVDITYILYDPSDSSFKGFFTNQPIKKLKDNYLVFSLNAMTGEGYVNLNGASVLDIKFDKMQYVNKKLLFGNFISDSPKRIPFNVYTKSIPFSESLILPFTNNSITTDTIEITLPCGQRNSEDDIDLLQSVCHNQAFKSNHINILVRNMSLTDDIKAQLNSIITETCKNYAPVTTEINNIIYFQ